MLGVAAKLIERFRLEIDEIRMFAQHRQFAARKRRRPGLFLFGRPGHHHPDKLCCVLPADHHPGSDKTTDRLSSSSTIAPLTVRSNKSSSASPSGPAYTYKHNLK